MPNPAITSRMSQKVTNHTSIAVLDTIRTETVLSRLPIHNLAKRGRVHIEITKHNERGEVTLLWNVIPPNPTIGEPRALAYKLDTIVINRRIDEAPRPLPEFIYLGSLRDIARELNLGNDTPAVKKALKQNAGITLNVKIHYLDKDGLQQVAEFNDTRYGVYFTGQKLPNGPKADGVYLMLHAAYRQVLNSAPVRPLDYQYLKELTPAAQRFYEIVSYKMFAAFKYKHPHASLPYSEYCTYSAQQRYRNYKQAKKQMYKVHYPHLQSGYLKKITYEETITSDGEKDWIFHYTPGPKALTEFQTYNGKHFKAEVLGEEPVLPLESADASSSDDARDLLRYFHRRFDHDETTTPEAKDLEFAASLITQHGMEKARFVVEYSKEAADSTKYSPGMLIGIRKYAEAAIKKFDAREKHRQEEQRKEREAKLEDRYRQYRNTKIQEIEATLSAHELEELKSAIREKLLAKNPNADGIGLGVQMHLDSELAERAGVPPYEEWRSQQA
jgi:hypothetical protein